MVGADGDVLQVDDSHVMVVEGPGLWLIHGWLWLVVTAICHGYVPSGCELVVFNNRDNTNSVETSMDRF